MNAYERYTNKYMYENDCGLTEMYRRMGVPKTNHVRYCNGRKPITDKGYKVAKFLNVPIWELWGFDE